MNTFGPHVTQDDDAPARRPETEVEAHQALQGMEDWRELARTGLAAERDAWFRRVRFMPGAAGAMRPLGSG